jgi:hypothetical protein
MAHDGDGRGGADPKVTPARERTIARMKLLVGATTIFGPSCASKDPQPKPPAPPLFTGDPVDASSSSGPPGGLGVDEPGGTTTSSTGAGPLIDPGYMVVDMMPEPSRCSVEGAGIIRASATVNKRADGKLEVVMRVPPPPGNMRIQPIGDIGSEGGGASDGKPDVVPDGRDLLVRSVITREDQPSLRIFMPLSCGNERGMLVAYMHWESAPLRAGDILPVELQPLR